MPNPGLYPREQVRSTDSTAERKLHAALQKHLPKGWYAWHSLRIKDSHGIDGEGDFVLAVPARGLLVLEVKGGEVEVQNGRWLQNGHPMKQAPRAQALGFVNKLVARLGRQGCRPPAFGVATCFPDTPFDDGPTQDDVAGRVLGQLDLDWLGDALPALIDRALPSPAADHGRWIEALHTLWGETWVPRPSLGTRSRLAETDRVALDAQQLALVEAFADNDRVLVEGGAGTGKSLVALEVARRFASAGERVLLVCFTTALAAALRRASEGTGVDVQTVRGLAKSLLEASGQPVGDLAQSDTWEQHPWRAAELLDARAAPWDAVVVDEGQDLTLGDWALIEKCAGKNKLWIFRDTAQSFWPDRELPDGLVGARFKLTRCYRTPPALKAVADAYLTGHGKPGLVQAAIDAGELSIVRAPSESAVNKYLVTELDKLRSDGLAPGDIAIVSLRGQSPQDSIAHVDQLGNHRLVRASDANAGDHIIADTFLRLKGLERPAVLVTDLRLLESKADAGVRMHIALTRTLMTARIVAPAELLGSDSIWPGA